MKRAGLIVGLLAISCIAALARSPEASPFDGEWSETIVGESPSCVANINASFTVKNGHFTQPNSTGQVNPNGSARGTASAAGFTATWTGHFSGNNASGRFQRNDGCVGRWEAVRK
jgi:hypothetical protein